MLEIQNVPEVRFVCQEQAHPLVEPNIRQQMSNVST